jgi:hypothetical protein
MDTNKRIARAMLKKSFAEAKELVFKSLYAKASLALDEARYAVANAIFNEAELDEMAQTKERAKETGAEIDRTKKRRDQKFKEWDAHSKDDYQGYYGKEAEFDKERDANWRAQDKQEAERDSKDLYGKGGKIIKKNKDDLIKKRPTYGGKAAKK